MINFMSKVIEKKIEKKNMAVETRSQNKSSSLKEFESLLNEDFKKKKFKENEIIKATS